MKLTSPLALLLLAVALLGFAHLAFLPPFEGFDELPHISTVQQIADTGTFPKIGRDTFSTDVESYPGPLPYNLVKGAPTYREFFAGDFPPPPPPIARSYKPGLTPNWQAQHPPLYYLVMTPFYKLARDWSWQSLFLLLRGVSWVMAFAGLTIGSIATLRWLAANGITGPAVLLVPAWPLVLPQFFPDMARMGNDSLCLLLMGIAWALLLRFMERRDIQTAVLLGLTLGLGLWTKAFFVAITGGIGVFLIFTAVRRNERTLLQKAVIAVIVAGVLGCGWYVQGFMSVGSVSFMQADQPPAFWRTLPDTFNPFIFLRGLVGIAVSFVWGGTWSFGRVEPVFVTPILLLLAICAINWLMQLRRAQDVAAAPLFIAVPFVMGLAVYGLTQMSVPGYGNSTPGWYLHILQAPLALVLVLGWQRSWAFASLVLYAAVFHIACWTMQLSLFSGCAFKTADYKYTQMGDCLIVPQNLAVLAWPGLGAAALLLGLGAVAAAYIAMRRELRPSSPL